VRSALQGGGFEVVEVRLPEGEAAKDIEVVKATWSNLAREGLTRSDALISVGGGATSDSVGFIAATWMRGVDVIHVPTTLLAMVDAAIGGKTGINTPEAKNLIGAFHDPVAVICDVNTLAGLPREELVSGMAEVVKSGLIGDGELLAMIESNTLEVLLSPGEILVEMIGRAINVKASIVAADPFELSTEDVGRAALNYGHTVGHAIERHENHRMRHGEAISLGMIYAAELAALMNICPPDLVSRHHSVLAKIGLPTKYSAGDFDQVKKYLRLDKKARGHQIRFVLLGAIGDPKLYDQPSEEVLLQAWQRLTN
jgi:3-dehydroquinate synthase